MGAPKPGPDPWQEVGILSLIADVSKLVDQSSCLERVYCWTLQIANFSWMKVKDQSGQTYWWNKETNQASAGGTNSRPWAPGVLGSLDGLTGAHELDICMATN